MEREVGVETTGACDRGGIAWVEDEELGSGVLAGVPAWTRRSSAFRCEEERTEALPPVCEFLLGIFLILPICESTGRDGDGKSKKIGGHGWDRLTEVTHRCIVVPRQPDRLVPLSETLSIRLKIEISTDCNKLAE